jgi:hypothetical protein
MVLLRGVPAMMTALLRHEMAEDGCYDFIHEGVHVGRLVWVSEISQRFHARGWWLTIPGEPDNLIYKVPFTLAGDPPRARAAGVLTSIALAEQLLATHVEDLLEDPHGDGSSELS